jgi:hypothetical protein
MKVALLSLFLVAADARIGQIRTLADSDPIVGDQGGSCNGDDPVCSDQTEKVCAIFDKWCYWVTEDGIYNYQNTPRTVLYAYDEAWEDVGLM